MVHFEIFGLHIESVRTACLPTVPGIRAPVFLSMNWLRAEEPQASSSTPKKSMTMRVPPPGPKKAISLYGKAQAISGFFYFCFSFFLAARPVSGPGIFCPGKIKASFEISRGPLSSLKRIVSQYGPFRKMGGRLELLGAWWPVSWVALLYLLSPQSRKYFF